MRFSLALVALVHRVEGGPAIAAHSPGPETHCVYERIASRRQANRITEAESHEGAHGNRITESQILRFGSTKGLKSQILESHVRFKQSQRNRRNRHKNDGLCDFMHKNEHSRARATPCGTRTTPRAEPVPGFLSPAPSRSSRSLSRPASQPSQALSAPTRTKRNGRKRPRGRRCGTGRVQCPQCTARVSTGVVRVFHGRARDPRPPAPGCAERSATKIIEKLKFEKKSGVYLSRTQI